jgi:quinoprotein dehydrogenase-associated probable ABC transporter substrate-binding protein
MSSASRFLCLTLTSAVACSATGAARPTLAVTASQPPHVVSRPHASNAAVADELRVCADPNNLPFSNARGEGFENAIASLAGQALHRRVIYTWWPQRRGFLRRTLEAGTCDVVMGVPAASDGLATTRPYYRSTYVFVSRRNRGLDIRSFDDPRLRRLTIGIQLIGDDYANPPAAEALATRHLAGQVRGFPVYGDYNQPAPARAIVDAVASGRVDVAVVWGPIAGFFARRAAAPLRLEPVESAGPFAFAIAMGVRADDAVLRRALDQFIATHAPTIDRVLANFSVPRASDAQPVTTSASTGGGAS